MSKKPERRVPEEQAATIVQIHEAIEALTAGDAARLMAFASGKWRARGGLPDGSDGDDLLSAAITLALTGRRRWNPSKVPFTTFLIGAMRSLASHARKARVTDLLQAALSEEDLVTADDEHPLDKSSTADANRLRSAEPNAAELMLEEEHQRTAHEIVSAFETYLEDDWEGVLVIQAWREGHDGLAIRDNLGLSVTQYETIMRRLRRKAKTFQNLREGNVNRT